MELADREARLRCHCPSRRCIVKRPCLHPAPEALGGRSMIFGLCLCCVLGSSAAPSGALTSPQTAWPDQSSNARATGQDEPRRSAEAAVHRFLTAFEGLDWLSFKAFFAEDATAFLPSPEPPHRHVGKAAIERVFREVFDAIRADSDATVPPFHRIAPHGLRIDVLANDLALASFMMGAGEQMSRRTILLRGYGAEWRIIHLHASNAGS